MIRRLSAWRRSIGFVVLIISTASAALLPLADAHAEEASVTTVSHVEEEGSGSCPPAHDELACQLCRVLRLPSAAGPQAAYLALVRVPSHPAGESIAGIATVRMEGSAAPRAPPAG